MMDPSWFEKVPYGGAGVDTRPELIWFDSLREELNDG